MLRRIKSLDQFTRLWTTDDDTSRQLRRRSYLLLFLMLCLLLVFFFRFHYGRNLQLSGDEVGVGVLQSVGKWSMFKNTLPLNEKTDIQAIRQFITPSEEMSALEVISTMRSDRLHPPLYFILLHFVIEQFGTSVAVLRSLSIIFSLLSIITIYFLGKGLYNEKVGLISALFMTLSAYCLEYSVMVRLYPLAMWLSLMSTLLVVSLVKSNAFHFRNPLLYLYIFISVAGLYTYYSFGVLIVSHFAFVLLSGKRRKDDYIRIFITYTVIFLLLIPWIFPMIEGVNLVQTKNYYFKGSYSLVNLFRYFFDIIFIPFKHQILMVNSSLTGYGTIVLFGFIAVVFLVGIYKSAKSKISIAFLVSVFLYFFLFILSDRLLVTKTMMFDRQHYFAVPVLLLLLASSVVYLPIKNWLNQLIICLISILFMAGLIYRYNNRSIFDGPYYFQQLDHYLNIHTTNSKEKENMILFNTRDKRYLLPFIYNTKQNFDLMIIPDGVNDTILMKPDHFENYKNIFIVNIDVDGVKRERLRMQRINEDVVTSFLNPKGFARQLPFVYNNIETLTINRFTK